MLELLDKFINEANQTNSNNDKKKVLEKYPELKPLLKYVYSPYEQFYVTSNNLKKRIDLIDYNAKDRNILNILYDLSNRVVTGHNAIALVNGFIQGNKQYEQLIYKIIDKNLETRLDTKSINKIFPNLIPEFSVALANSYDKYNIDFSKEVFYASRKLDGVRCVAIKKDNDIKFYSRNGKEFFTLDNVKKDILTFFSDPVFTDANNFVLDGEICLVDDDGNENFQDIMKEIRRKDYTISKPLYNIFDCLSIDEFESKKSKIKFSDRYQRLRFLKNNSIYTCLKVVDQTFIKNENHLVDLISEAEKKNWEGLILRKDVGYQGKRSNDLLKVKKFFDKEFVVENIEVGDIRYINSDGNEVKEKMLSKVVITHKGNKVGVGSGFSIDQRKEFYKKPDKIIGKTISVKFFEETTDQFGNFSLRFPTLKVIHGNKREV